jgi:hypothetical protein
MKRSKRKKPGQRHPLLMYRRMMDRLWGITMVLGLVLLALWWFGGAFTGYFRESLAPIFLAAAITTLVIGGFAFVSRYLCYVQAKSDHLLIATPFIRLKTSYRRVHEIRSTEFWRLHNPENMGWAARNYLDPFFIKTAVTVNLKGYPMSPKLLRLFFPKEMVSDKMSRYVLVVRDWMTLSTELDSRYGGWRGAQGGSRQQGFMWRQAAGKKR